MDIGNTLSSLGNSLSSAASSFRSTCKEYGSLAIEKGKIGYNKTVELVNKNPKAALITTLAVAAVTAGTAYYLSGANPVLPSQE